MLKLLLAALLVSVSQPAESPQPSRPHLQVLWNGKEYRPGELPPKKYQGLDFVSTRVEFVQDADSKEGCEKYGTIGVIACTRRSAGTAYDPLSIVVMPNPCQYPEEDYARIMCHELGHVRGWHHN